MSSNTARRGNAPPFASRGRGRTRPGTGTSNVGNSVPIRQSRPDAVIGETKLEFVPSISRSGGDNGQGDTLKDKSVQEKYWRMIQQKLAAHWDEFPSRSARNQLQTERESNILLFLRKLREGVLSSQRTDEFALEVYETSFYLAIIFDSSAQASSALSHLPELYSSSQPKPSSTEPSWSACGRAEVLTIVSLIFHLSEAYPSQSTYYRQARLLERRCPLGASKSDALKWVSSIRESINCKNYAKFEILTRQSRLITVVDGIQYLSGNEGRTNRHLVQTALCSAINRLRSRLRSAVWTVLRSSYREFAIGTETDTSAWLSRSLFLESVGDSSNIDVEEWMEQNMKVGHVIRKEGFKGRWSLKR